MGEDLQTVQNRTEKGSAYKSKLEQAVAMTLLPTPRAREPGQTGEDYGDGLNDVMQGRKGWNEKMKAIQNTLLPTPNTLEGLEPKSKEKILEYNARNRPGRSYATCNLRERIAYGMMGEEMQAMKEGMLPTPTVNEVEHKDVDLTPSGRRKTRDKKDSHSLNITDTIAMIPTPTRRDYKGSSNQVTAKGRNPETNSLSDAHEQSQTGERTGMRLHSDFVCWMQGFPITWLDDLDETSIESKS
jgi:hypothetical protein